MKRAVLLIIGILVSLILKAQEVNTNGFNRFFYPNGQVSSEGIMRDGKPDGYWRAYYVTGIIKSEGKRLNHFLDSIWIFYNRVGDTLEKINYKYGKRNGYYLTYKYDDKNFKEGYIYSKELYLNDLKDGKAFYYYPDGSIHITINHVKGKKQGIGLEYSEEKKIISILEYRNGYLVNKEKVNRLDENAIKQGVWKEFYESGKIHFERNYLDGQLNGYYKEYEENGNLRFSIRYENGNIINETAELVEEIEIKNNYDENGILVSSGTYKENIPIGIHRSYAPDGKVIASKIYDNFGEIISEGIVNENGERSGNWKDFYTGGNTRAKGKYEKSLRTGNWEFYRKNGKIEQTGSYRNGRVNGLWKWYFKNGQLLREEVYFNGREDGMSVEYSELGIEITKGEYINGEKEGRWFYQVGDHSEKGNYITGLRDGLWKYFYKDGNIKFTGNYRQGLASGKHKYYYENESLKEERYYERGLKQKNWKKYDIEGNIILTINYRNDIEKRINGIRVDLEKDIKQIK